MQIIFGILIVMQGIVHWWYVKPPAKDIEAEVFDTLTKRWLVYTAGIRPAVARRLGITLMALATVGFITGGFALCFAQDWWTIPAMAAAGISLTFIALYWEIGMIGGALIDIGIIVLARLWEI